MQVMEAFMYRFHPQWRRVRETRPRPARSAQVHTIQTFFTFTHKDPANIRNILDVGGGR